MSRSFSSVLLRALIDDAVQHGEPRTTHGVIMTEFDQVLDEYRYYYDIPDVTYWYHAESDSAFTCGPGELFEMTGEAALCVQVERDDYVKWFESRSDI